ncbi:MAG: EVE domain-containing protein [Candidatus Sumerlaeaceae bacterium]
MPQKRYWLMKSEADCFSFDDLLHAPGKTTCWDGVRNFEARNLLRDQVQVGDEVLYYHSNSDAIGVAGIAKVVRAGYPDSTAFDKKHEHYDPKSKTDNPTWYMVDLKAVKKLPRFVRLAELRAQKSLQKMALFTRNRLSVTPVTEPEWNTVLKMGGL